MLAPVPPIRRAGALALVVVASVAVAASALLAAAAARPVDSKSARTELVTVPRGSGVAAVAQILARRGIVRSALYFEFLSLATGSARRLQAGIYRLSPSMPPAAVLGRLVHGEVATARVTVVPGMTVAEVARVVQAAGLGSAAAFLRYARSAPPPVGFDPAHAVRQPLEGYLYPDTYTIPVGGTLQAVVAPMLAAFARAFGPQELAAARAQGLTPAQAVTLASIVEREAADPAVRRDVAGVFLNRLRLGMPLGSEATVYYAADVPPGTSLTRADLTSASPYNTLNHIGLPPGPICSPGGGALAAVLHPAHVPYLYFYSLPDGRYVFSRTYAGLLAAERRAAG
jgi:UPF0755 protein